MSRCSLSLTSSSIGKSQIAPAEPDEMYGYDTGKSVVLYFLSNATSWRGEVARRVKAELKSMAGVK
jgi:hypothetical protein